MAYNDTGSNAVGFNIDGVVSDGGATLSTASATTTETTSATESGTITGVGTTSSTETAKATESGAIDVVGTVKLNLTGGYQQAYNNTPYNKANTSASATESGTTTAEVTLSATDLRTALETGTFTTTATFDATELRVAPESGTLTGAVTLSTTELREAIDAGTITTTATVSLSPTGGYQQGYNTVAYNKKDSGAFADEFGRVLSSANFDVVDSGEATESGTVTAVATPTTTETASATESGTVTVNATLAAVERAGAVYQRIFTRDVDLSFTKSLIVEFDEDKRMTEIQEVDDTLSDETRVLEFTAQEDGSTKDISGGKISWSLADNSDVLLSDDDPEVSTSIVDGTNGRFDVTIDGFDVDPGGYRQRVEVVDTQGKVTRSNGPYRIREF